MPTPKAHSQNHLEVSFFILTEHIDEKKVFSLPSAYYLPKRYAGKVNKALQRTMYVKRSSSKQAQPNFTVPIIYSAVSKLLNNQTFPQLSWHTVGSAVELVPEQLPSSTSKKKRKIFCYSLLYLTPSWLYWYIPLQVIKIKKFSNILTSTRDNCFRKARGFKYCIHFCQHLWADYWSFDWGHPVQVTVSWDAGEGLPGLSVGALQIPVCALLLVQTTSKESAVLNGVSNCLPWISQIERWQKEALGETMQSFPCVNTGPCFLMPLKTGTVMSQVNNCSNAVSCLWDD